MTKQGILRKDNFFEVVFNPGSDKRGKRIYPAGCIWRQYRLRGQVFLEDTGGVWLAQRRGESPTQHTKSIGARSFGQSAAGRNTVPRIPVAKSLWRRHPNIRQRHHARRNRQIRHGIHLLATRHAQHRPADQKQRHIGPNLGRDPQPLRA